YPLSLPDALPIYASTVPTARVPRLRERTVTPARTRGASPGVDPPSWSPHRLARREPEVPNGTARYRQLVARLARVARTCSSSASEARWTSLQKLHRTSAPPSSRIMLLSSSSDSRASAASIRSLEHAQ